MPFEDVDGEFELVEGVLAKFEVAKLDVAGPDTDVDWKELAGLVLWGEWRDRRRTLLGVEVLDVPNVRVSTTTVPCFPSP